MVKNEKGITLVALIITIIVFIILTSITAKIVIDKSLVQNAKNTINQAENSVNESKEEANNTINTWFTTPGQGVQGGTSYNLDENIIDLISE